MSSISSSVIRARVAASTNPAFARHVLRKSLTRHKPQPLTASTAIPRSNITTSTSNSIGRMTRSSIRKSSTAHMYHDSHSATIPPQTRLQRPYTFHIGASWAGKPEYEPSQSFKIPFPSDTLIGTWRDKTLSRKKAVRSADAGEDFFFVQEMRNHSGVSFGVADGVGGWVDSGVDPALFSQALMFHAHRYSRNAWAGEPEIDPTMDYEEREQVEGWEMTPYECLDLAYGGVLREKSVQAGSSTACIISLNASSGLLRSAKQLTKLPANAGRKFSRACVDSPAEADTFEMKLRDGDLVIAYTDGFSDNVFPSEMVTICSLVARAGGTEDEQVQAMADRMVEYARRCMKNKTRVSPFERDASRQGMYFRGGKEDDVTVIVGLVRETS
ncbi:hypothetical protein CVT24_008190 [Panaeolus cyanescens]|uniref:Protein phosphatase n=1 Tax=Panaeolus cyanescens TaxID=181874 RepID=A0A409W0H9_9AGAR|nr:hypothetical protein CVT24_008190 [Panaeolus cyanescens]